MLFLSFFYIYVLKKDQVGLIFLNLIKNCPEYSEITGGVLTYNPDTGYFGMQYAGKWNDILFAGLEAYWLYNKGNEFPARTGGWDKTINSPGGSLEKLSDHIKLVTNVAGYAGVAAITNNYIDLSDFNMLYVKLQCESSSPWTSVQVGLLKEGSTMVYPWKVSGSYNDIVAVNISECTGMYRISVWAECNNNIPSTVDVYSVRLS